MNVAMFNNELMTSTCIYKKKSRGRMNTCKMRLLVSNGNHIHCQLLPNFYCLPSYIECICQCLVRKARKLLLIYQKYATY